MKLTAALMSAPTLPNLTNHVHFRLNRLTQLSMATNATILAPSDTAYCCPSIVDIPCPQCHPPSGFHDEHTNILSHHAEQLCIRQCYWWAGRRSRHFWNVCQVLFRTSYELDCHYSCKLLYIVEEHMLT